LLAVVINGCFGVILGAKIKKLPNISIAFMYDFKVKVMYNNIDFHFPVLRTFFKLEIF